MYVDKQIYRYRNQALVAAVISSVKEEEQSFVKKFLSFNTYVLYSTYCMYVIQNFKMDDSLK